MSQEIHIPKLIATQPVAAVAYSGVIKDEKDAALMANDSCSIIWRRIPETSVIKRWVKELAEATAQPFNENDWAMIGHGVVIEHHEPMDLSAYMLCIAEAANMDLIHVPADNVLSLPMPDGDRPTILFLEPGQWVSPHLDDDEDDRGFPVSDRHDEDSLAGFRKSLAKFIEIDGLRKPVVIVTALKKSHQLDASLRTSGLFDRKIMFPALDPETHAFALVDELGKEAFDECFHEQLANVGLLLKDSYPGLRRRGLMVQWLRRRAWQEKRKIRFRDLAESIVYGTTEEDISPLDQEKLHGVAVHEAGHALVCYLESEPKQAPLYSAVGVRGEMMGVVLGQTGVKDLLAVDPSFKDIIYSIRVLLAGRAAEQLVLGIPNVSAKGSSSDLKEAMQAAIRLFGRWGYATESSADEPLSSNLAVVIGEPSPSEYAHVERLAREFLDREYKYVYDLLRKNRILLDKITTGLCNQGILLQQDFESIVESDSHAWRRPKVA